MQVSRVSVDVPPARLSIAHIANTFVYTVDARDIGTMQACKSFTTCRPPTVVARFVRAQVAAQPRRMAVRAHAGAGKAGEPRIVRGKCFVTRDVSLCGWEARLCFCFCVEEDCASCGTARGY